MFGYAYSIHAFVLRRGFCFPRVCHCHAHTRAERTPPHPRSLARTAALRLMCASKGLRVANGTSTSWIEVFPFSRLVCRMFSMSRRDFAKKHSLFNSTRLPFHRRPSPANSRPLNSIRAVPLYLHLSPAFCAAGACGSHVE